MAAASPIRVAGEGAIMALPLLFFVVTIWSLEHQGPAPPENQQALWSEIQHKWPVLTTADTLLALQAIIRLALFVSGAFRTEEFEASAMYGETSGLFLMASLSRCLLQGLSPSGVYTLDGPLGGPIYITAELLCSVCLVYLSRGVLQKGTRAITNVVALTVVSIAVGNFHHHAVADRGMRYLDVLFSIGQLIDLFAAGAFFLKTMLEAESSKRDVFSMLAYLLLPIQQLLATYFLLTWLDGPFVVVIELVGAGHPFQLLQLCSIVQAGMYIVASAVHLAAVRANDKIDKLLQDGGSPQLEIPQQQQQQQQPLVVSV